MRDAVRAPPSRVIERAFGVSLTGT